MTFKNLIAFFLLLSTVVCCTTRKPTSWSRYIDNAGTYSSARAVDLNNDHVLDVVMGAGGQEERYSKTGVIALDGTTGDLLWATPGDNQYVGSAVFRDLNNDGIPDIIIGGRWAQLSAINGADGSIIWTFFPQRVNADLSDSGWFNFTTPQFVPDQDGDGIEDLLIANGGNPRAAPGDPKRPIGKLLVLNSVNGKILASVLMPDGKETYMSVICTRKDGNPSVLFGTGGETIGGHLYRTGLQDIMRGNISGATILATSESKGFIASPVLADITEDGIPDIVINAVDGKIMAIDGASDSLLWQVSFPGTEAYTVPAVGYFNEDSIPDFFTNFAIGTFPNLHYSLRFLADGKTGKIRYQDTIPSFQYASPVAADLNGDGVDEAVMNQSFLKRKQFENTYYSCLVAFDFRNKKFYPMGDTLKATNLASTPWIGDLDGDHEFDIIYSAVNYHDIRFDLARPLGLVINCYKTGITIKKPARWGAYMGTDYTGRFKP